MSRNKRRKTEHDPAAVQDAVPEVAAHIDTEIGMRTRLAETLQARIDWALALKTVLERGGRGLRTTPESFQQLASEALVNAERPAQALFADPYGPVQIFTPASPPAPVQTPYRRPPPRDKAPAVKGKPTFLYVHAHAIGRPEPETGPYLLLRCPACSRTAFSSLQGLLNHARISHTIEWGTHDACIKACAVEEPDLDIESGSEVGIGPSGIRPGLQTIFERAVGVGDEFQQHLPTQAPSGVSKGQSASGNASHDLGLHEETPALAPFLGKEVHRREIRVYDEDVSIDDIPNTKYRSGWKMSFAPRHQPLSDLALNGCEEVQNVEEDSQAQTVSLPNPSPAPALVPASKSRFHFAARITISDRSLFVGKVTTPEGTFTRKWMIAVDSPSYAIPIGSVLKYIKVTPLTGMEGSASCYVPVPIAREQPFVVLGMANDPFLARIELVFNDIKEDATAPGDITAHHEPQTIVVEHWVDLDPMKSPTVVTGDEQLIDAELDLRTEVKPTASAKISFESRRLWNDPVRLPLEQQTVNDESKEELTQEYRLLVETVKRFPLVLQERDRAQPEVDVPYRLVSSRSQFNRLILGRQQAIKWGRARAIRDAYLYIMRKEQLSVPDLSVADVYLWLRDSSEEYGKVQQRLQTASGNRAKEDSGAVTGTWCPHCGFEEKVHQHSRHLRAQANGDSAEQKDGDSSELGELCILLHGLDLSQLHAGAMAARRGLMKHSTVTNSFAHPWNSAEIQKPYRKLVHSVDPAMLTFVENVVESAHIPAFQRSSMIDRRGSRYPLDRRGSNRDEVEMGLAPLAVLTHSVRLFLEELVTKGLSLATLEKAAILRTLTSRRGGRRVGGIRTDMTTNTLLTPRHILEGVKGDLGSGSGGVSTDG